jgi:hypothetical protein
VLWEIEGGRGGGGEMFFKTEREVNALTKKSGLLTGRDFGGFH